MAEDDRRDDPFDTSFFDEVEEPVPPKGKPAAGAPKPPEEPIGDDDDSFLGDFDDAPPAAPPAGDRDFAEELDREINEDFDHGDEAANRRGGHDDDPFAEDDHDHAPPPPPPPRSPGRDDGGFVDDLTTPGGPARDNRGRAPVGEDPFASADVEGQEPLDMQRLENLFNQREQEEAERFEEDTEGEEGGEKRRLLAIVAALVLLAAAGGIVYVAYDQFGTGSGPETAAAVKDKPLISAERSPYRIKPNQPGGMTVDHQDVAVLNRGSAPAAGEPERLLPPPETPLPRPGEGQPPAPPAPPPSVTGGPPVSALPDPSAKPTDLLKAPEAAPSLSAAQLGSVPVFAPPASSGGLGGQPPASAAAKPPAAKTTTLAPSQPPAATGTAQTASAPAERTRPLAPAPLAGATGTALASAPARTTAPASTSYRVQLASLRDNDAVTTTWNQLQAQHKDLLGGLSLTSERADLGARGVFYRLQAGPFENKNDAQTACSQLKGRGLACVVVVPR